METRKRKRDSLKEVVNCEQNEVATETTKRQKQDKLIAPKHEKSVQWFHQRLNAVQASVGFPEFQALRYFHANLLQLPLQQNVLTPETLHRHYQRPLWTTSHPVPVVTQAEQLNSLEWVEPMVRLYQAKAQHCQKLNLLKMNFARKKNALRKIIGGRKGLCSTLVFRVAEELDRDPDKWFTDRLGYDYYFTGGNLGVIVGTQFRWLINTVGESMNTVDVVPFELDGSQLNVLTEQAEKYELGEGGAVFEILHRKMSETGQHFHIALRRKFQIDVLYSKTGCEAMKTHSVQWPAVPFISCCFLEGTDDSVGLLCTSDLEKTVKVFEYTPKKVWLCELQLEKSSDDECWTCLRPLGRTSFICLDRSTMKLLKLQSDKLSMAQETPLSGWLWPCENATCLEVCPEESLLLVGTTHRLLVLRYEGSKGTHGELQQMITFTHNLQFHLTMIRYQADSTRKQYYVHLSSQLAGDTMLCTFSKAPPKRFTTRYLPVKPLTIQESVHMARTKGKCLYPAVSLQNRFKLFHSGIAIVADRDRFHLLVQNSLGDIYQQRLDPDSASGPANTDQTATELHAWMLQLRDSNIAQVPVANDYKIQRGIRAVFRTESRKDESKAVVKSKSPRWRKTVEQLHQYKDHLAGPMLSIWGFRPDVTETQKQQRHSRHLSMTETISVEDRIADWLDAATTEKSPETVEILDEPIVMDAIVKEESQLQLPNEEGEDRGIALQRQTMPEEMTPVNRVVVKTEPLAGTPLSAAKGKSARKRYVQGF